MTEDIEQILFTPKQIAGRVAELGGQITRDYAGHPPLLVGTLKGSFLFLADLARAVGLPATFDFVSVSSYGCGTCSSGAVLLRKDLDEPPEGKDILVVEDIVDSGRTLSYLAGKLKEGGAASVRVCTFLDKPARRAVPFAADYVGFTVPDAFVVGYGMDYNERYRNLPFVGVLSSRVYAPAETV